MRAWKLGTAAAVVMTIVACGRTDAPQATTNNTAKTLAAQDTATAFGWKYWNFGTNAPLVPPKSANLAGATYARSYSSTLLGRRWDGMHGSRTFVTPSSDPNAKSGPRFSLYKPWFWNGKLIVFAKGYGEPDATLRLPEVWVTETAQLRDLYLSKGYGVAWTSCSENGYAVRDCAYLTDQLSSFWAAKFNSGRAVSRVYLVGASLGGQVVQLIAESASATKYKGALATCGVLGGSVRQAKYIFDTQAVFDVLFPKAVIPGTPDGLNGTSPIVPPSDWDNDLLDGDPYGGAALAVDTAVKEKGSDGQYVNLSAAKVLATAHATDAGSIYSDRRIGLWTSSDLQTEYGTNNESFLNAVSDWLRWVVFFHQKGSEDMIFRSGGTPEDNSGVKYFDGSGSAIEGVATYPATSGYAYLTTNYEPTGAPRIRVATLHNQFDPAAPEWHEGVYQEKVKAGPSPSNLVRLQAAGYGHCAFDQDQITLTLEQFVKWADGGTPNWTGIPSVKQIP